MKWLQASTLFLYITVLSASGLGGLLISLRRSWTQEALTMIISAGGGLLLAITLLDLLPHSFGGEGGTGIPLVLVGFSSLLVFDLIRRKEEQDETAGVIGVYIGLLIHAFLEGMSLLASYRVDVQLGYSLLSALILHKIPDGITVASLFMAITRSRWIAFLAALSLGVATLLGIFAMTLADAWLSTRLSHAVLSFTTGIFLYVSASHLVPLVRRNGSLEAGLSFVAAILAYMLVMLYTDSEVHPHV